MDEAATYIVRFIFFKTRRIPRASLHELRMNFAWWRGMLTWTNKCMSPARVRGGRSDSVRCKLGPALPRGFGITERSEDGGGCRGRGEGEHFGLCSTALMSFSPILSIQTNTIKEYYLVVVLVSLEKQANPYYVYREPLLAVANDEIWSLIN